MCCTKDLHILNGRFSDVNGEITCTANDESSVVDYSIASSALFERIIDFKVDTLDISDHFPIVCKFALDTTDLVDADPLARTDIHLKLFDTFN
ncbi:hypothetical protein DPMN_164614 [Dreissena polymorpha]|uniref:Endonuclease/exonuclease/phosphatase domain-containing protein n=1 Tax=Dreissena polymorpha TaxID=45954 RepID=A0A9D4EUJ2_DREPO|nr:hypothetical protein DPMN_164614 [Dreissena polymorpha]